VIPGFYRTKRPLRRSRGLSRLTDIGEIRDFLHENLSQLVDSVAYESVARPRDRRSATRHIIDGGAHGGRTLGREHPRDCRRRSELSSQTLHENCPNPARLNAVGETSNGFGFQTGPTGHVSAN
jgi:hypothetical protein